jgi:formiminotetrahydrofolate cyclodeaminase
MNNLSPMSLPLGWNKDVKKELEQKRKEREIMMEKFRELEKKYPKSGDDAEDSYASMGRFYKFQSEYEKNKDYKSVNKLTNSVKTGAGSESKSFNL